MHRLAAISLLFSLVLSILLRSNYSHASAWVVEGLDQTIYKLNYYQADEARDTANNKVSIPKLSKYEFSLYKEQYFRPKILTGHDFMLTLEESEGTTAFNDTGQSFFISEDFFMRFNIVNHPKHIISSQINLSLPVLYRTNIRQGVAAKETFATELRLMYVKPFKINNYNAYINSEIGYNHHWYLSDIRNLKMEHRFGIHLDDKNSLSVATYSEKESQSIWICSDAMLNTSRYDLHRIECSYSYKIKENTKISLSLYQDIYGKNTSIGNGLMFFVNREFKSDKHLEHNK